MKHLNKLQKYLLYLLPVTIFLSYYPVITIGKNDTMNLEFSILLIWLLLFSLLSLPTVISFIIKKHDRSIPTVTKIIFTAALCLSIYMSLSVFWSLNFLRAFLTTGIIWCIFISVVSFYLILRNNLKDKNLKKRLLKFFFISSFSICIWCWIQCIIDVLGINSSAMFLCDGCKAITFGFPHPNGFAAEPQYMGNLLIMPALTAIYFILSENKVFSTKTNIFCAIFFSTTLFLTLSRGAIYAFCIALFTLFIINIFQRRYCLKKVFLTIPIFLISFAIAITTQGIFSELSYTNDTFFTGVNTYINQLSLGTINLQDNFSNDITTTENPSIEEDPLSEKDSSIYDGYVESSTNERLTFTVASVKLWAANPSNLLFGVGIGGAGASIHQAYLSGEVYSEDFLNQEFISKHIFKTAKTNVQNQYVEILLEFGILGSLLAAVLAVTIIIWVNKKMKDSSLFIAILVGFAINFLFFSGLPNALHIYLMFPLLLFLFPKDEAIVN